MVRTFVVEIQREIILFIKACLLYKFTITEKIIKDLGCHVQTFPSL